MSNIRQELYNDSEFEFTNRAERIVESTVSDLGSSPDPDTVYANLKEKLNPKPFSDYLKRYIYRKAEIKKNKDEVTDDEYRDIIILAFTENNTPASFDDNRTSLKSAAQNWLKQRTASRNTVLLLGFGLRMSAEDVNGLLVKALHEQEIDFHNYFEVLCWYCYKNEYRYPKFKKLLEEYSDITDPSGDNRTENTAVIRSRVQGINGDDELMKHLFLTGTSSVTTSFSRTAFSEFTALYKRSQEITAKMINEMNADDHLVKKTEYEKKLIDSCRYTGTEIKDMLTAFDAALETIPADQITPADIERMICAAVPKTANGNMSLNYSDLKEQFEGKLFSRQRIAKILNSTRRTERFDIITLSFFIYSQEYDDRKSAMERYHEYAEKTNRILERCSMGNIYPPNPYEAFILMCVLSDDPLCMYSDVMEMGFGNR